MIAERIQELRDCLDEMSDNLTALEDEVSAGDEETLLLLLEGDRQELERRSESLSRSVRELIRRREG